MVIELKYMSFFYIILLFEVNECKKTSKYYLRLMNAKNLKILVEVNE
jgi:hypothetical protein